MLFTGEPHPTPCLTAKGVVLLLNSWLPASPRVRAFRAKSAETLVRYFGGDLSLVGEVQQINQQAAVDPFIAFFNAAPEVQQPQPQQPTAIEIQGMLDASHERLREDMRQDMREDFDAAMMRMMDQVEAAYLPRRPRLKFITVALQNQLSTDQEVLKEAGLLILPKYASKYAGRVPPKDEGGKNKYFEEDEDIMEEALRDAEKETRLKRSRKFIDDIMKEG